MKSTLSIMTVVVLLLGFSGAAMAAVIPHGEVTYLNNDTPPVGTAHTYPGSPVLHVNPDNANYAHYSDSGSESADQLADGVATTSYWDPSKEPNLVYWAEDCTVAGTATTNWGLWGNGVWNGPHANTTFDLGNVYTDLNSLEMWYMVWGGTQMYYPGITGIKVSFSADDVTFTTPVLYDSAPYKPGSESGHGEFHTVTQSISYNDPTGFQYVNIEWQGVDAMFSMGEVTFDGVPIPEPATLAILGIGGMMILLRRRR